MKKKDRSKLDTSIWRSGYDTGRKLELFSMYAIDIIPEDYLVNQLAVTRQDISAQFEQFCISFATEGRHVNPAGYRARDAYLASLDIGRTLTDEELDSFKELGDLTLS